MKKLQLSLLALFCAFVLNSANAFDQLDLADEESFSPDGQVSVTCYGFHSQTGISCCTGNGTGPNSAAAEGKARGECRRTNRCGDAVRISCSQD